MPEPRITFTVTLDELRELMPPGCELLMATHSDEEDQVLFICADHRPGAKPFFGRPNRCQVQFAPELDLLHALVPIK